MRLRTIASAQRCLLGRRTESRRVSRASSRSVVLGLVVVGVAVLFVLAFPVAAAASSASLSGEALDTAFEVIGDIAAAPVGFGPQVSSASCNPAGTSSFSFTASGAALGPYPGTFTASGSVSIGPEISTVVPIPEAPELPSGPLTSFSESFTIVSPTTGTTVTGTKALVSGSGSCDDFSGQSFPLLGTLGAFGHEYGFNPDATYSATISTPSGQSQDAGTTAVRANELQAQDAAAPTSNGVLQGGFEEFFLVSNAAPIPATVTLSPAASTNPVGTPHTVTATVTTAAGAPVPQDTVVFAVRGDVNTAGSCVTDSSGQCSFTYRGPMSPGEDVITGCAGAGGGAPCGTASKTWVPPASTAGCQLTDGGAIVAADGDHANFGGNATSDSSGSVVSGQQDYKDQTPAGATVIDVHSIQLMSLVCDPQRTTATIYGQAQIGESMATHYFEVDVTDPDPGTQDTYRIRTDTGYDSGPQPTLAQNAIELNSPGS
jgi:hypothetical protein